MKKISIVFALLLVFVCSSSAYAKVFSNYPNGGYLQKKLPNSQSGVVGSAANFTDNDMSTSSVLNPKGFVEYQLNTLPFKTIYFKGSASLTFLIYFGNGGSATYTVPPNTLFPINVSGWIIRVTNNNSEPVTIDELDVYNGTVVDNDIPPDPVSSLRYSLDSNNHVRLDWVKPASTSLSYFKIIRNNTEVLKDKLDKNIVTYVDESVELGKIYTYTVKALNGYGTESDPVSVLVDLTIPPKVENLSVSPSVTSVDLTWNKSSDPLVDGYRVLLNGSTVSSLLSINSYKVTNLKPHTDYEIDVVSVSKFGVSSLKNHVSVKTLEAPVPPSPYDLKEQHGVDFVELSWSLSDPSVKSFVLYLNGTRVGSVPSSTKKYVFKDLKRATSYSVSVSAENEYGLESPKTSLTVTTDDIDIEPPAPPQGLVAKEFNGSATVSFKPNTELDLAGYNIYVNGTKLNSKLFTSPYYHLYKLENGKTYSIYVTAVDTSGNESGPSNTVSASPSADKMPGVVDVDYNLKDVADGTSGWFGSQWSILAFAIAIPMSFIIAFRIKKLINSR